MSVQRAIVDARTAVLEGDVMAAKPVMIGDRSYLSKRDAEQACRDVLYHYQAGNTVDDAEHQEFLLDLLDLHQDAVTKIGVGIAHFEVRLNEYRKPGFYIIRSDGSETDFSFMRCLTPATHRQRVLAAFRRAVADQVLEFKNSMLAKGPAVCAVTGTLIADGDIHVDHHDPEFKDLAHSYALAHDGWDAFPVLKGDGMTGSALASSEQRREWSEYHREHAHLQITSRIANLSLRRRGVKTRDLSEEP